MNQTSSHKSVLLEIEKLNRVMEDALKASQDRAGVFTYKVNDHSDAKLTRNLCKLVETATHVRSAASSRASSKASSTARPDPEEHRGPAVASIQGIAPSSIGDMTDDRRRRVEAYIQTTSQRPPESDGVASRSEAGLDPPKLTLSTSTSPETTHLPEVVAVLQPQMKTIIEAQDEDMFLCEDDDGDGDDVDGREFLDGLLELAKGCLIDRDFSKAVQLLTEALDRERVRPRADESEIRGIQLQLALCHFFQGKWRKAAPIVDRLATGRGLLDGSTCNLLHALSLAQLCDPEYSLDSALRNCRKAMLAKEKLLQSASNNVDGYLQNDYAHSVGLCATIYNMKNDPIRYNICQKKLPVTFEYKHPANELDYILKHPQLLNMVLGDDAPEFLLSNYTTPEAVCELDAGTVRPGTERLRRTKTVSSPL